MQIHLPLKFGKKYFSDKYHVKRKFGHFFNALYIYFREIVLPPAKIDSAPTPMRKANY